MKKNSEVQKMAGAENFSGLDRFAENDQSKGMFGTAPVNSSSIFSGAGAQPKQFQLPKMGSKLNRALSQMN